MTLYLASGNPGKLREFSEGARLFGHRVEPVANFRDLPPCPEDGQTFEENACKKALHYSRLTEGAVFADDSGISVDALSGAPGLHSARFAGAQATEEENNAKLLHELRAVPEDRRKARYICVIGLAERGRLLTVVQDMAEGQILLSPRGEGGFGYDPLFFYPPLRKTFADLSLEEKFAVSHRGKAFHKLADFLRGVPS